eukprot:XP_011615737.1 PREDICTED: cytoskeleton-associated protein 2-like isoform X1 [Takifugu rubripes]
MSRFLASRIIFGSCSGESHIRNRQMEKAAGSRQRCNTGNKENAAPANRGQSFIKNVPAAQFHQKGAASVQSRQPDGRGKVQACRQASLTAPDNKGKAVVREVLKPPPAASRPAPGMYKGKMVESKVACIWRGGSSVDRAAASRLNQAGSAKTGPKSAFGRPAHKCGSVAPGGPRVGPPATVAGTGCRNPSVSSIQSQKRVSVDTAEDTRAKLAGWRASTARTLQSPAMNQTKVFQMKQADPEDLQEVPPAAPPQTPPDPSPGPSQQPGDDLVTLGAPDGATAASPGNQEVSAQVGHEADSDGWRAGPKTQLEDVAAQVEIKKERKNQKLEEGTPQRGDPSVVKYSVTTTPYLQSVKKTIEDAGASASRRTRNIKDLKFLTPVRRSCRIERKSWRLPAMLQDHDPCVSSLVELLKLDDSPNAFIYRRNPALEDPADRPELDPCTRAANQ